MQQKVKFKNKNRESLAGVLHVPNAEKPPAIVMASGFSSDKNESGLFSKTAQSLCSNGFLVLRFDFSGSGESEGNFVETTISKEAGDLESAIEFIKTQNIKKEKIGLIGSSLGGVICFLSCSLEIKAIAINSTPLNLKEAFASALGKNEIKKLESHGTLQLSEDWGNHIMGKALWEECKSLNIANKVKNIMCPLLIIQGSKDHDISINWSKEIFKLANEPKKLELIEDGDHIFSKPKPRKQFVSLTVKWFESWLK